MKQTATIWQAVSFFSVPTLPRSSIFYLPFSTLLRTKFINNTIQKTNLIFSNVFHILSYSKILPNNRVFPSSCHAVVISVTKTKNFPQDFFVLLVRRRMASTMHHLPQTPLHLSVYKTNHQTRRSGSNIFSIFQIIQNGSSNALSTETRLCLCQRRSFLFSPKNALGSSKRTAIPAIPIPPRLLSPLQTHFSQTAAYSNIHPIKKHISVDAFSIYPSFYLCASEFVPILPQLSDSYDFLCHCPSGSSVTLFPVPFFLFQQQISRVPRKKQRQGQCRQPKQKPDTAKQTNHMRPTI